MIIKDKIIRDIRALFKQKDDYYYDQLKRVSNFWIKVILNKKNNGDRNKNLSLDEYLHKTEV